MHQTGRSPEKDETDQSWLSVFILATQQGWAPFSALVGLFTNGKAHYNPNSSQCVISQLILFVHRDIFIPIKMDCKTALRCFTVHINNKKAIYTPCVVKLNLLGFSSPWWLPQYPKIKTWPPFYQTTNCVLFIHLNRRWLFCYGQVTSLTWLVDAELCQTLR